MPMTSAQGEVQIVPTMRGFQSRVRAGVKATKVDPLEIQVRLDKKSLAEAEIAARKASETVAKARNAETVAAQKVQDAESRLNDERARGAASSAAAVEAAEERLAKSRTAAESAARTTQLAELRLEEARKKHEEGSAAIVAAENRLATAREKESSSTRAVSQAETALATARKGGAQNAAGIAAAEDRLAAAKRGVVTASTATKRAMVDEESARNRVAGATERLSQSTRRLEESTNRAGSVFNRFRSALKSSFDDGSVRQLDRSLTSTLGSAVRLAAGATAAASAVVGIGAATGPVLALSSALVTAAGSAALIPAALAGAGAAFGTVKLGISGISDAFKGYTADLGSATKSSNDNAKTELSNAKQIRDAKKSISDAQKEQSRTARDGREQISAASARVVASIEDEKAAQKDLTLAYKDATRALEDLWYARTGNSLDAESAEIAFERQQIRFNEIMKSGTATALDRREANNDLLQSQHRMFEAQNRAKRGVEDYLEAERKGVAGSDQVVAAQDRLKDAQDNVRGSKQDLARTERDVAEANQDAAARVSEAVENLADVQAQQAASATTAAAATSKYNDALAKLAPNARKFVEAVIGLKNQWDDLKNSVQDRMFQGFGEEVTALGNAQLPILKRGLTGIAGGMNTAALETSKFLRSTQGLNATDKILGNTSLATSNLARSAKPLTSIFMQFASIGSEFLPVLADGFSNAAERAERFVNSAAGAQKIKEWIGNGLEALKQLGQLAGNVAGIVGTVWSAMNAAGGTTLQLLVDLTGQAEAWLKSAEGQHVLNEIFTTMRDVVNELKPGVSAVLGAVKDAFLTLAPSLPGLAGAFSDIAEALSPLVGWIATGLKWLIDNAIIPFANWARENPGHFQAIAVAIGAVTLAVKGLNMVKSVTEWATGIGKAFGIIGDNASKNADKVDDLVEGKRGKGGKRSGGLKALKGLGAGAGVLAGAGLVGELTPGEAGDPNQGFGQFFGNQVGGAAGDIVSLDVGSYVDRFKQVWGRIGDLQSDGIKNLKLGFSIIGVKFGEMKDNALAKVTEARDGVVNKFRELKDGAVARVTEAKDWVTGRFTEAKDSLVARATEARDWVTTRFTELKDRIVGKATEARDWVTTRYTELKDWISGKATEARDWVTNRYRELKDWIVARATEARDWVTTRFTELKDSVIGKATEARDWVTTRFRELKDWIIARATEARDWVTTRFTEAKDWIIARATEARDWVTTRFRELKDGIIARATEARDWVNLRFQEAKDWIIARATEARDWVVTRFTELKDGAIARVTEAKDWIVGRATELKDQFIARVTELKDTAIARWNELKAGFREPIRWVVDTVYNTGIGGLWNKARAILPSLPAFQPVDARFRTGGPVAGRGTGTSDSILARVSDGEHVWTKKEVDRAGGHGYVMGLRAAALNGTLPQFATGGPVMWQDLWSTVKRQFPSATLNSSVRPGDPGEHGAGRAIDIGGPMLAINRWLAQMFPGSHELIHTPGINLFNGRPHMYNAETRAGHYDHVHWANVAKDGSGIGGILSGAWDWVLDQVRGIYDTAANPLRDLANSKFPGDSLVNRIPRDMVNSVLDNVRDTLFAAAGDVGMVGGSGTGDQLGNARIVGNVARAMGFGRNGLVVALATALQESGLRNLNYGDRDSLGLFQQRPSMGWGSPAQILNPAYAASKFFLALRGVRGWEGMPVTVAAQRVQRSAFPGAYAKWVGLANSLASQVGFRNGGNVPGTGNDDDKLVLAQSGERVLTRSQNDAFESMVRANFGAGAAVRASQRRQDLSLVGAAGGRGSGPLIGEFHAHQNVDVDTALQRAAFEADSHEL